MNKSFDLINKSLFQRSILLAIRRGHVKALSDVSEEKSEEVFEKGTTELILRDHSGNSLARLDYADICGSFAPSEYETNQDKAIAWAYSMGYDIPQKIDGCSQGCLVTIGLFIFIFPGVLLLVWLMVKNNQYERDMSALISKWVDAGRPEPGEGIKQETPLMRIEGSTGTPVAAISTEERLQELNSMKEKGLINDEEYETLRMKALGL